MRTNSMKKLLSVFVAVCVLAGLVTPAFSMAVVSGDGHEYKYVGAGMDKEYDGKAVSLNVSEDISVDGETGVLSADNVVLTWHDSDNMTTVLQEPPSETGSYWVEISSSNSAAARVDLCSIEFVIWPQNHVHSLIYGEGYGDEYHSHYCEECGFKEMEKHTGSEWQYNENGHYKLCSVCGLQYSQDSHKTSLQYDDSQHWQGCEVCGYKIRETNHNFTYTDNKDGATHKAKCSGCDYSADLPHNFGSWQPVSTHGEAGEYQYRTCGDCGFSEERSGVYTVTYNYEENGGTSASVTSKEQAYNSALDLTPTAIKSGWEFVGWSFQSGIEPLTDEQNIKVNSDMTLYAIFKKTQNVRFYSKSGSIQTTIKATVYNNEKSFPINDLYPDGLEPDSYSGYKAIGWRADTAAAKDTVDLHSADGTPSIPDVFTDYYAVYTREITLSYDMGEADFQPDPVSEVQIYNSGGNVSAVQFYLMDFANLPDLSDDFQYWAIGNKQTGEKYKAGDTITLTQDTTAYAVWTADLNSLRKYTVKYNADENGGTGSTSAEFTGGGKADLTVTASKAGWDFIGWNTDPNAKEGLKSFTVNETTTLYAIYKKDIKATFVMGNNEPDNVISAVIYNKNNDCVINAPDLLSVEGFTPCGWLMSGDNSAKYYSGTVRLGEDKTFTPVYVKNITLTYDTNGSAESIKPQQAVLMRYGTENGTVTFTLEKAPVKDGYEFTGWTISGKDAKLYKAGEAVTLSDNAVAAAQWKELEKPKQEELIVKYNAAENGGGIISTTAQQTVTKDAKADLSVIKAEKTGWEFVGWNTDKNAHEPLTEYTVTENVTLYAIFKKDVTASFYSGESLQAYNPVNVPAVIWNSGKSATVTAPAEAETVGGWIFDGWRADKHAVAAEYKANVNITISKDTDFYAVYKRDITVTGTTEGDTYTQYSNTAGGVESIAYMLTEPEEMYKENEDGTTERFAGWDVVTDDGEVIATQNAGTVVNIDRNTTLRARYINVPEGAKLAKVETVGSSVISPTRALVIKEVTNDTTAGNDIISEGFVYWSKLGDGTKYTVTTENTHMALEFLAPDTEYYYYAFAENKAGTAKGYIKTFKTEPDGNTPTALTITPEYVSVNKGDSYQLLATLLPVAAENKILWSSSDPDRVSVDENGMLTAHKAGDGIVITATTEVGRLTAECIVDVTEDVTVTEKNFSEWHMASHTYNGAANGFDWDTADADGGNHTIATAYLARWEGAVMEDADKYPAYTKGTRPSKDVDEQYHVQNIEWLPARESARSSDPLANDDEIKSALMEYGAVYTLMCIDWSCFDSSKTNYYCPDEINYNGHAITIVGWDDNYDKTNFKIKPPENGAFICKNSWGTDVADKGFFYISYYDACMGRLDSNAVVTGAQDRTNYNEIYQYDPLGAVGYIGYEDTTCAANVFPESGKKLTKNEDLRAVSFYTYHKNTSYDVYVVTDYKNKDSLSNLTTPLASGVIKNSGYHTIDLPSAVSLKSGTRFAVVVKLDVLGEDSYFYCEYPVYGYSSKARSNSDESYFSYDGSDWDDITDYIENGNFCIKAFTDNGLAAQSVQLFSAIDNDGREYESDRIYTVSEAKEMGMPVNENYEKFIDNKNNSTFSLSSMSAASPALGSMPSIIKAGSNSVTYTDGARFPSYYNLAEMGLVSSVKDQGEWGTCWAHAMYASLESCMMRSEKTRSTASGTPQVILSRSTLTMAENASVTLAKKITPVSTEDKKVIWTSSNDAVVTVDTNGTIRSLKAGSATISATTASGYTGSCSVVVESDADDGEETVAFEDKVVNKEIGDRFMVAYSVTPMKNEAYNYGWVSGNPNVATVNTNGIIEAKNNGTAEISILSDKGMVKDTVTVVVGDGYNFECKNSDIDGNGLEAKDGIISGTVTTKITSNAASDNAVTAILAIYDVTDLVGFVPVNVILHPDSNDVTFENVSFDGGETDSFTLRCYTWESVQSLLPIAKAAAVDISFP